MVLGGVLCHVVSEWMLFRKWPGGSCGSGAVSGPFLNLRSKALLWPFFSLRKERSWFTRIWELVNNPQCFVSIAVSEDQKRSHLIFMSPFQRVFNSKILSETIWHFHKLGFFCYFYGRIIFCPCILRGGQTDLSHPLTCHLPFLGRCPVGDLFQGSVRIERACLAVVSWSVTVIGRVSLKNRAVVLIWVWSGEHSGSIRITY